MDNTAKKYKKAFIICGVSICIVINFFILLLLLPSKFDNPDWDYMDKYIKSLSVNSIMQ